MGSIRRRKNGNSVLFRRADGSQRSVFIGECDSLLAASEHFERLVEQATEDVDAASRSGRRSAWLPAYKRLKAARRRLLDVEAAIAEESGSRA